MNKTVKNILIYVGIALFFLALSYFIIAPQVLQGKIVNQSDISGYVGMAHEANEWNAAHPADRTAWTDSMFGGMPTTMITGNDVGDFTQKIYNAFMTGKRPASYMFISLIGAFLLMLSLGCGIWTAIGGAIAVTLCSYNLQIIQVGHNAKMVALAWLPWVLASVIFTYKSALGEYKVNKWLPATFLGSALFGMALNFQIKANHIQISYYLAIIILSYVSVLFVWLLLTPERRALIGRFFAASGLLLVLGLAGIGANANRLIPTYEYTAHTMRGGSELNSADGSKGTSKGLDIDYATAWSYGWEELPNMLIPNFNGGASAGAVNPDKSATIKLLKSAGQGNLKQIAKALPLYWGPQPFTAGPMYMGAITIFLFILGLCICGRREKWWIMIPTVIGICLAVGYHFMPFTELWYYHIPFYNKFRTVSMALIILQFTLPMLGFMALDKIVKEEVDAKKAVKSIWIALGISAGFCALCILFPTLFGNFEAASDAGQAEVLAEALQADRQHLFVADAITSFITVCIAAFLLLWTFRAKESFARAGRGYITAAAIALVVLINMLSVGRRYLNKDHYVTEREFKGQFTARTVDKAILEDESASYRVLDLTSDVFNSSFASYFHKNVGGYSPVKLQRYQDLIERHINKEINKFIGVANTYRTIDGIGENIPDMPVLNMLNTKYVIIGEELPPVENPLAFGPCWVVDTCIAAHSPEEEITMLGQVDLKHCAVVGDDFAWARAKISESRGEGSIEMTEYAPNQVTYRYTSTEDIPVIFSEVYYADGWKAWIDGGQEVDLFRADWTLRGAILPKGEHTFVMRFAPDSYRISSNISRASSIMLILLLLISAGAEVFVTRKSEN